MENPVQANILTLAIIKCIVKPMPQRSDIEEAKHLLDHLSELVTTVKEVSVVGV